MRPTDKEPQSQKASKCLEADNHPNPSLVHHSEEPHKGETAVCGSSIFVRMTRGGDHWLPPNRASGHQPDLHYYCTSVAGTTSSTRIHQPSLP